MDDWLASIILSWSYSLISLEEYNASLQTNYFKAVMILSNWKSLAGNWSFLVRPNITKHVRTILFYRSVYVLLEKDKTYTVKKEAKQLRRFVVVLLKFYGKQRTGGRTVGQTDRRKDRQTDGQTVIRKIAQTNKIIDKGWQATTQISRAGLGSRKNNMEAGKQTKRQSFKKIDK